MSNQLLFGIVLVVFLHHGLGTTNFALHKPAVQSSTLYWSFGWTADKAVDGNTDGSDPNRSGTCSSTDQSQTLVNNTWEVNIGFPIIMKTITVYGRTSSGSGSGLIGTKLYLRNASGPSIYALELVNNPHVYTPTHVIASVVSLMKTGQIMIICEVTIDGECLDGMFSESCNETCGKCIADKLCNKTDGTCPNGCSKGWKGPLCKEACERGKYGYDCNETCGKCLYGNNSCSISDGNCTNGCQAGWQGVQCNKECERGKYGYNCNETCGKCFYGNDSCSLLDGNCTNGCQAGWKGLQCDKECAAGTYGVNCNETCGACLNGPNKCSKTDGLCIDSCQAGWVGVKCKKECDRGSYGFNCSQNCGNCMNGKNYCSPVNGTCAGGCQAGWNDTTCKTECIAGTYGINCGEICGHCLNGPTNCSKIDGLCTGGCVAGYTGEQCTEEMFRPVDAPNVGVIVGSVAAAVGVSLLAIVIIVFFVKKRKKTNNERRAEELTTVPQYANLVVGNPDATFKVTDRSIAETNSGNSPKEETSVANNIPTNSHTGAMGANVYAHSDYEQLRDATRSAESAYSTLNHNQTNSVPTLQSLDEELRILDEKRKLILASKEILLRQEVLTSGETKQ